MTNKEMQDEWLINNKITIIPSEPLQKTYTASELKRAETKRLKEKEKYRRRLEMMSKDMPYINKRAKAIVLSMDETMYDYG